MRTIRTKVYQYDELPTQQAKDNAIEWYRDDVSSNFSTAWDDIKEDAKQIGLKLISLDDHRANEGDFMLSANEVAQNIFNEHGESCSTYKTATEFMENWQPVFNNYMDESHEDYESNESEEKLQELEDDFLHSLLEDYRIMYNQNVQAEYEDEYIIDILQANNYEFTKDGKRFHS